MASTIASAQRALNRAKSSGDKLAIAQAKAAYDKAVRDANVAKQSAKKAASNAGIDSQADKAWVGFKESLTQVGLGALAEWAWDRYKHGASWDQIRTEMRKTKEYKARFPAIDFLVESGQVDANNPEPYYRQLEEGYRQKLKQYGIPAGQWDKPSDIATWITGRVSVDEVERRLRKAQEVSQMNAPLEVRAAMGRLYGVQDTAGALTAYWLDPDLTENTINQNVTSAQIAAQADLTKFGLLTREEAERLTSLGVDQASAQEQFQKLQALGQVKDVTLRGEQTLSNDVYLKAAFEGDAASAQAIRRRQEARTGAFEGQGGFTQQQGRTGIGSASGA